MMIEPLMGQEIVYCCRCQVRLATGDFDKGRATRVGNRVVCADCLPDALSSLTPEERCGAPPTPPARPPSSGSWASGRALPSHPKSTARIRTVAVPARPDSRGWFGSRKVLGVIAAAASAVALLVWVFGSPGNPRGRAPSSASSPESRPPVPDPRERDARAALERARRLPAEDLEAKIAAYAEAVRAARGTALYAEAEEAHRALLARRDQERLRELAALDEKARPLREREQLSAVLAIYEGARIRHPEDAWQALLEGRLREERVRVETLFRRLSEEAAQARRSGDRRREEELRARVAGWGLADRTAELDRLLSGIRPERPWRAVFDGRSLDWMSQDARSGWEVVEGAVRRRSGPDNAAQSRADFGDGEFRIRFETSGTGSVWFAFRQGAEGSYRVHWEPSAAAGLSGGTRELIVSMRGDEVTARLDGAALPVQAYGKPRGGRLQFNAQASGFRVLSIEYREP